MLVGFLVIKREPSWFGVEDRLMVYCGSGHNDNYCMVSIIYLLALAPWAARVSSLFYIFYSFVVTKFYRSLKEKLQMIRFSLIHSSAFVYKNF